tara:strand:- start:74 stop:862 length:789 start_codon:yes stop_codon:yes gene_type:complete
MSSPRKVFSRGATLLEVLFASFLLITALSLTIFLIHHSFQSEADSGLKVRALHDAQNALEEIRAAAYADFKGGLASVDGRLWPCTLPDYLIESSAKWQPLDLPCSELESQYDEGRALPNLARKVLTQSTWKVDVEVRRKDDGKPLIHLTTLVADLAPDTFELRMLAPDGLKVGPEGELRFRAVAYDSSNEVIEDLILTWYVEPINSFGSVHVMRRDGWECVYKNIYQDYGNRFATTPGQCRIVVRGEYKGRVQYATMEITNE